MTSRERVLQSLSHKSGELPIDFGGLHTSLHLKFYLGITKILGWKVPETEIQDWFQMIVFPHQKLLEYFGTDCLPIYANPGGKWKFKIEKKEESEFFTNEWGIVLRKPGNGYFFDLHECPLQNASDINEVKKYKLPDPEDPACIKGLRKKVKRISAENDKALVKMLTKR